MTDEDLMGLARMVNDSEIKMKEALEYISRLERVVFYAERLLELKMSRLSEQQKLFGPAAWGDLQESVARLRGSARLLPEDDDMTDEELLRALAPDDPVARSREGSDDGCFWCDAEDNYLRHQVDHDPDCAWVLARYRLGLPLGDHTVREISRRAEYEERLASGMT